MARRDYYHDPDAPAPNRLVPAVVAVVIDAGQVLLGHRVDNDRWALPGGVMEVGETPAQTAVRETFEETGLEVEVEGLVGVYSDPGHVIAYGDGEVRQQYAVSFRARLVGGELRPQLSEARKVEWVPVVDLDRLSIHPAQRLRIEHGITWTPTTAARFD